MMGWGVALLYGGDGTTHRVLAIGRPAHSMALYAARTSESVSLLRQAHELVSRQVKRATELEECNARLVEQLAEVDRERQRLADRVAELERESLSMQSVLVGGGT